MLPLNADEIVQKVLEGEGDCGVPPSLVLLHLFSIAPSELESPHQVWEYIYIYIFIINF